MIQQDIHLLSKVCVAWLSGNGYSEARIRDYLRLWDTGIMKFMRERTISTFSLQVADDFLNAPFPFNSPTYRRAVRRSVGVLSDFIVHGKVSRRIVHRVFGTDFVPLPAFQFQHGTIEAILAVLGASDSVSFQFQPGTIEASANRHVRRPGRGISIPTWYD